MSSLDQTKARLLEAAGEEFAQNGFEGARVRSICTRAGVNLAAVNYHFGDKEQLYLQAVLEAHRCGVEMPGDLEFFAGAPAEQLRRYIRHFLTHILALNQAGWHQNLILREMMRPTKASETLVETVIRPRFERLVRVLAQVCPSADARHLHVIAFSVIGQCVHYKTGRLISQRLIGAEEMASLDIEFLTDHITAFSLAALGLAPPLDEAGRSDARAEPGELRCAGSH
jgi:AcrR family transcriptional regulator